MQRAYLQNGDRLNLKNQASLEFVLILGAISLLAFSTLSIFNAEFEKGKALLNLSLPEQPNLPLPITSNTFNFSAYVPFHTLLGNLYSLEYVTVCPNGSISISLNSDDAKLSARTVSAKVQNIFAGYVNFIPESYGFENITLFYNASCNSAHYSGQLELHTYATAMQPGAGSTGSFIIDKRDEYILYRYSKPSNVYSLSFWGHCQYNFPYVRNTSVVSECFTKNAWDYNTFSYYCYQNNKGLWYTTCVYPMESAYNIESVDSTSYSFLYNFSASIYLNGEILNFTFNNTKCTEISSNGKIVGNACITNITGAGSQTYAKLISNATKVGIANQTLCQSYTQAKNNMESVLGYFNSSYVDDAELAQINSAINYYLKASTALEEYGFEGSNCKITSSYLECRPIYPLAYIIDAQLNGVLGNETLYYQGSVVNIR